MNCRSEAQTLVGNILEAIPAAMADELVETLTATPNLRIERIISWGQVTAPGAWYDQAWSEWVILLQGEATLQLELEGLRCLQAGDWIVLPAHCRHRVESTSSNPPAVWLAVHFRDA